MVHIYTSEGMQPLKMMEMFTSMKGCSLCIVIEIDFKRTVHYDSIG